MLGLFIWLRGLLTTWRKCYHLGSMGMEASHSHRPFLPLSTLRSLPSSSCIFFPVGTSWSSVYLKNILVRAAFGDMCKFQFQIQLEFHISGSTYHRLFRLIPYTKNKAGVDPQFVRLTWRLFSSHSATGSFLFLVCCRELGSESWELALLPKPEMSWTRTCTYLFFAKEFQHEFES